MIGNADGACFAAFHDGDDFLCPSFHVGRIVDPVQVDVVGMEAFQAFIHHCFGGMLHVFGNLRGELGRDVEIVPVAVINEFAQNRLRSTHSVHGSCVP